MLAEELQYYCAPPLMRLPPILLPGSCIPYNSYQRFYEELLAVTQLQTIQDAYETFHSSFATSLYDLKYERLIAEFMDKLLHETAEKFGHASLKVMCSQDVTLRKTELSGIQGTKCDPNIIIFLQSLLATQPVVGLLNEDGNGSQRGGGRDRGRGGSRGSRGKGKGKGKGKGSSMGGSMVTSGSRGSDGSGGGDRSDEAVEGGVKRDDQAADKKLVLSWEDTLSVGELKCENQTVKMEQVKSQTFTAVQHQCRVQPEHLSQQTFTCCGSQFRFFHFDPEGYAVCEPYNTLDPENFLLLINHTLLLSTQFTSNAVFAAPHGLYPQINLLTKHMPVGIRGRRLLVYKVQLGNKHLVEKIPSIHEGTTHEVCVYQILKQMDRPSPKMSPRWSRMR
jgi:hypothetical protein